MGIANGASLGTRKPRKQRTVVARLTQAAVVMLAIVLVVRLGWGWYVWRELSQQIEEIRRRGEPVHLADYPRSIVPDADDAWPLIAQAAGAITVDSPRCSNLEYSDYPPYPAEWMRLAANSEKAHTAVFGLMQKASERSGANSTSSSGFSSLRMLANVLADAAIYAHLQGRDAEAIDRLASVYQIARATRGNPMIISQLVGIGIESLANSTAQIIAPGLEPQAKQPATREQLRRMIASLLDDDAPRKRMRQSFLYERAAAIDKRDAIASRVWCIRPLAVMALNLEIRDSTAGFEAMRMHNMPAVMASLGLSLEDWESSNIMLGTNRGGLRYSRWFGSGTSWSPRYIETHFRVTGDRRCAAISLAAQLYRMDHAAWPIRLELLVPDYLPTLPTDPYHEDGRAIGYVMKKLPSGADRPVVYFDADQGASANDETLVLPKPMYGWQQDPRSSKSEVPIRQYRDLSRFAPSPAPSTQAVDDDPEKADAPGK